MRKTRIITYLILITVLTVTMRCTVKADPDQESVYSLTEQESRIEYKIDELNTKIQISDNKLIEMAVKINENSKNIEESNVALKEEEKKLNEYQELLSGRLRSFYMMGFDKLDMLQLLLGSRSFTELCNNSKYIELLATGDQKLIDDSEKCKASIELESIRLEKLQKNLELDKSAMESDKTKQLDDLAELEKEKSKLSSKINSMLFGSLEAPATNNPLIRESYKYLGIPYLWGGEVPSTGMDCSGFVKYVYRKCGYDLTRTTYTQVKEGTEVRVDLAELKEGDLIFFGDKEKPHHVAMYIGNNMYIHAPQTGDKIKISKGVLGACTARRIINN